MSGSNDKMRELYATGLRNQHAIEQQAVELLQRQVDRLENYPEMAARIQQHIQESEAQKQRLEELLQSLGTSHSSFKDTITALGGNLAAIAHSVAPDEVIKNTFANYAFEHYEIASYKSLLTMADAVGHGAANSALNTSLQEEISMAQWIDQNLASTTLKFMQRSAAGEKAGL